MKIESNIPSSVVLELTYECNHNCIFCSCPWEADKSLKQKELSTDDWKKIIIIKHR